MCPELFMIMNSRAEGVSLKFLALRQNDMDVTSMSLWRMALCYGW